MQVDQKEIEQETTDPVSGKQCQYPGQDQGEQQVVTIYVMRLPIGVLPQDVGDPVQIRQRRRKHAEETFFRGKRHQISHTESAHHMGLDMHISSDEKC